MSTAMCIVAGKSDQAPALRLAREKGKRRKRSAMAMEAAKRDQRRTWRLAKPSGTKTYDPQSNQGRAARSAIRSATTKVNSGHKCSL